MGAKYEPLHLYTHGPGRVHGYEELAAAIAFEDEFAGQPAGAREK